MTTPAPQIDSSSPRSRWPDRLIELGAALQTSGQDLLDERAAFWLLLNTVLQQRIRAASPRVGPITHEDLHDLASEKSLELMNMLDTVQWDLGSSSPGQVVTFVSTVARNGLIDFLRRSSRRPVAVEQDVDTVAGDGLHARSSPVESPDTAAERRGFVEAIRRCVQKLDSQHQKIWFFRVFLDMPTKQISTHPEVKLKTSHVNVIMQRCRDRVRACVRKSGYAPEEMPPGTFAALWRAFRVDEIYVRGSTTHE